MANEATSGAHIPAIGLTLASAGAPMGGGGMSTKSFLSSLMAVSMRAWSCLDSVTYPRLAGVVLAATRAARGRARNGAVAVALRLADRSAQDAILDMIAMNVLCAVAWARQEAKAR